MGVIIIAQSGGGNPCPVKHHRDHQRGILHLIYAHMNQHMVGHIPGADSEAGEILLHSLCVKVTGAHQNAEGIPAQTSVKTAAGDKAPKEVGDLLQHAVSKFNAENVVDELKVSHIGKDDAKGFVRSFRQSLPNTFVEIAPGKQPCQIVVLRPVGLLLQIKLCLCVIPDAEEGAVHIPPSVPDGAPLQNVVPPAPLCIHLQRRSPVVSIGAAIIVGAQALHRLAQI